MLYSAYPSLLENIKQEIPIFDQLRRIGLNQFLQLPKIVVLGIEQSGKSSLLEHILELEFLPRGQGVVTRRPLELRLLYAPGQSNQPTAEFVEEIKGRKFTNFEEVRQKIEELTDKINQLYEHYVRKGQSIEEKNLCQFEKFVVLMKNKIQHYIYLFVRELSKINRLFFTKGMAVINSEYFTIESPAKLIDFRSYFGR